MIEPFAVLNYLQAYASSSTDKTALYFGLAILFLIIYFAVIWFIDVRKSTAVLIAFLPVFLLDYAVGFGKYTFTLPFDFSYSTNRGYITLSILDWIFNFGLFKSYGLTVFNSVNGSYFLTGFQNFIVYFFVYADSIIEFLLIAYFLYTLFDRTEYAVLGASIPVILYTYFTNPLKELADAKAAVSHILYFFDHATQFQLLVVIGTAFLSFLLVIFLISTVTGLFVSIGKSTIKPGLEASMWEVSLTGLSFGLAFVYSVAVILHPEYSWYVLLPVLIVYSIIRSGMNRIADSRRAEKRQKQMIHEAQREAK